MTPALTLPAPPVEITDEALLEGDMLIEESLVEEVSIDGMCGVY